MKLSHAILVVGLFLLLASCAPQHSKDMQQIELLRAQAEELVKAQSLMGYKSWVFGARSNQDSLYRTYGSLFTLENIKLLQRAEHNEPDSVQQKRLRYFRRHFTFEFISKEIAPLTDKLSNMEADATVALDGKEIRYRQVSLLLSNEKSQRRRAVLYTSVDALLGTFNRTCKEIEDSTISLSRRLGYDSYNHMTGQLKGIPLDSFGEVAGRILVQTDSIYKTVLNQMVGKYLSSDLRHFYRYDLAPLFRSRQFDKYFPASTMVQTVKSTYAGLGVDIDAQKNLHIDADVIPTKNPRAVCFPIDVPNDVRLSIKPVGGFSDYAALYHEMGHGQHYAHTKERAIEFKYLGESTVTEAFAFLSEYILANQAWLRLRTSMPTPTLKDYIRFQAFYRLFYIRRYCAKFLYELQLHAGASHPEALYARLLSDGVGYQELPSDKLRYLIDVDANYYVASYLRAWFLEAQLNSALTRRFGVNWFEHPHAGEFLESLWAKGDRLNGEELAQLIGFKAITPDAWLDEIKSMILFSTK